MRRKWPGRSPLGAFLRSILDAVVSAPPISICSPCRLSTDEVLGEAGDFSVCARCQESITSETGLSVRPLQTEEHDRRS